MPLSYVIGVHSVSRPGPTRHTIAADGAQLRRHRLHSMEGHTDRATECSR